MVSKDLKADNNRLCQLMNMAKLGWWEADFNDWTYICSDFIVDLLGLKVNSISFLEFKDLIREDYRIRISNEFISIKDQEVYEQTFPIYSKYGIVWVHSKLGNKEIDERGHLTALGFLQCIEDPEKVNTAAIAYQRVNNLLYQLNSISHSLLSFLQMEDITDTINKILKDILLQYNAGRTYIFEYDFKEEVQSCTYEVTQRGVSKEKEFLQRISFQTSTWWTEQMLLRKPIILFDLDDMPPEASEDKKVLEVQGIKSLMVVPLISKNEVWGYMGIDMVDEHREWSNEDYQWLASLANIISICVSLHKSEIKAKEEKRYLDSLYRHMPIGYIRVKIIHDSQGNFVDCILVDCNHAAEEILEYDFSHQQGKSLKEIGIKEEDYIKDILSVLNSNLYKEKNFSLLGKKKYCHSVIYSPQKDEGVILFSDMTETFTAHEALDQSEKILRNIYKNLPAGIELYDKDGYLIDLNDKEEEIFGLKCKEEALGVNVFENPLIPEDIKTKLRQKENIDFTFNYDFSRLGNYYHSLHKDKISLITKVACLYNLQNEFQHYLFINIDNTETTNAYSKIQEFEDFFTLVGDYAKVGYAHFDALSRDGYALSSWYKNVGEKEGTPLPEIIGKHKHFHPEDRAVMLDFLDKVMKGEATHLSREVRILRDNNYYTWTNVNVLVRDYRPEDGVIEMVCINYDITNLKDTEAKLIIARDKAETLDRLKSAFLANMSHEIRTPLNAIVGFSNLLVDTEDKEERKQYITIVQENNELLLQLISDILDLSKIEAGTFDFVNGEVDVNQLCTEIVCMLGMKANGNVQVVFDEHLPACFIYSDKNRLTQVISNFVNNALKFTSEGFIKVGYRLTPENEIKFYVSDTGIGIPDEKKADIFDRFVKLNSFVHGTGLGLSICKSIVEQMGGRIGVDSCVGKGSCFWFTHPYNQEYAVSKHTADEITASASVRSKTPSDRKRVILIAEDTDSNYLLVSTLLKKEYSMVRARNGEEAVNLWKETHPDIILMDIKMPVMGGLEATRLIRETDPDVPIIAITAFAFNKDMERTLEAGCNDYISKPVSGAALKTALKKWLDNE